LILGNLIKQNYEGILLVHESNENYVVSNTITKNDQHGIYLTRESNNNLIFKNEILENAICIEEDDCNGNLYWDNGLCIYYGAPFFLIIIFGSLGVVCITILVLLEIKRRRTHRF
jgi:parallel beta-helix repeat protein